MGHRRSLLVSNKGKSFGAKIEEDHDEHSDVMDRRKKMYTHTVSAFWRLFVFGNRHIPLLDERFGGGGMHV